MQVLAGILAKRFELLNIVRDYTLVEKLLKSPESKRDIRESLKMSQSQFNILYSKLKICGAINDNKINPKYIPNVQQESNEYRLILIFDINNDDEKVNVQQ